MTRVLVTGANGFVGQSLSRLLHREGFQVRAAIRQQSIYSLPEDFPVTDRVTFDLDRQDNDYNQLLDGVEFVVHLAARVHRVNKSRDDLAVYRRTNVSGTRLLAEQAARRGVQRFIFLSTIKVNGEYTTTEKLSRQYRFAESDLANPQDSYSISKFEAERAIYKVCESSTMKSVILRPPLVYGPGVKANFLQLLKVVARGYPLPFASIKNLRSILFIENLCNGILACMIHPDAANQIFLISDYDVSIPELIRKIASAMGRKAFLIPLPISLLKVMAVLSGKTRSIERLTQSLVIDNSKIKKCLEWSPPYSLDEGLASTVEWYMLHS